MICSDGQSSSYPRRQDSHVPQVITGKAATRSPTASPSAPGPVAATTPACSAPRMCGRVNAANGWLPDRAVTSSSRPTLTAATRTSTSPGPGRGTGTRTGSSTSGGPNLANTTAVIVSPGAPGAGQSAVPVLAAPGQPAVPATPGSLTAPVTPGPGTVLAISGLLTALVTAGSMTMLVTSGTPGTPGSPDTPGTVAYSGFSSSLARNSPGIIGHHTAGGISQSCGCQFSVMRSMSLKYSIQLPQGSRM